MSHQTRREVDPDAMQTLHYVMAAILGAIGVLALGAVIVLGESFFPETVLAVFGGFAIGLVPWFASNPEVSR